MEFILETVSADEFLEINQILSLKGVLTTPSLFIREGADVKEVLSSLLEVMSEEQLIYVHTIESGFRSILKEARALQAISKQVIPVLPFSMDGLMAMKACRTLKVPAVIDHLTSAEQAEFALNNGAHSLLFNAEEIAEASDPIRDLKDVKEALSEEEWDRVIVSGLKQPSELRSILKLQAKTVCLSEQAVMMILNSPVSQKAVAAEKEAWQIAFTRMELFD